MSDFNDLSKESLVSLVKMYKDLVERQHILIQGQETEIKELKAKYQQEFDYIEKKFSDGWWNGVKEYNEQLKAQEK
jgi:hypothetical protein